MMFRVPISLMVFFCSIALPSESAPGWVSLTLTGPNKLRDDMSFYYYANNVLVGTPPASESLLIHIGSSTLAIYSDFCAFCPGPNLFSPALSSTYKSENRTSDWGLRGGESILAQDTISFGGALTANDIPINLVVGMQQTEEPQYLDGHWGVSVNSSDNRTHILKRLHDTGALLDPVVGLRLGDTPETSRISIGALDPNDFEGTMNWVPAESVGEPWDNPATITLDGIRGFGGSLLPYEGPLLTYIDTLSPFILVPNAFTYMSQDKYVGPIKAIHLDFSVSDGLYSFICNETQAYVPLSVDINGINYQIDSKDNLLRNTSILVDTGFCSVGITNFTRSPSSPVSTSLGVPFLRSVYLAYKFPTQECPTAYYGFAFPKGANRTSSMIAQKPRETPSASSQCLSFVTPTSTPTVSTPPSQVSAAVRSGEMYNIWSDSSGGQVRLKGVDDLVAGVVSGVATKED